MSQRAMCQLFGANMSEGFWPYAVETAVYLINCSPTTMLKDKTPFEAWTGKRPNIKRLRTFGETGYVHIPPETRKKWTKKSRPCRLLSYIPQSRSYKLWDPSRHMVVVSPNVDFDESSILPPSKSMETLHNLSDAFGVEACMVNDDSDVEETTNGVDGHVSKWESDEEVLGPRATEDEEVPNGIDPVVPPIPREPDAPAHQHRRSEVEQLADSAGPHLPMKKGDQELQWE